MSARRFATSVVITLASLPSCATTGGGGGHNPPPPPQPQIDHRPDGTCWTHEDMSCPPDASCNPPPPRQVDCDTGAPLPPPGDQPPPTGDYAQPPPDGEALQPELSVRIDHRADNTCWRRVDAPCPPKATCNPPPPVQVDCDTKQPIPPSDEKRPPRP